MAELMVRANDGAAEFARGKIVRFSSNEVGLVAVEWPHETSWARLSDLEWIGGNPYESRAPMLLSLALQAQHVGLIVVGVNLVAATIRGHAAGKTSPTLEAALAYERHVGIPAREWLAPAGHEMWQL